MPNIRLLDPGDAATIVVIRCMYSNELGFPGKDDRGRQRQAGAKRSRLASFTISLQVRGVSYPPVSDGVQPTYPSKWVSALMICESCNNANPQGVD